MTKKGVGTVPVSVVAFGIVPTTSHSDRTMDTNSRLAAVVTVVALPIFVPVEDAASQPREPVLARSEQLAEDILSRDSERRERAVIVAERLGPSRLSDEVRLALITLLEAN